MLVQRLTTDAGSRHSCSHSVSEVEAYVGDMAVAHARENILPVFLWVLSVLTSAAVQARNEPVVEDGVLGHLLVHEWRSRCDMPVHTIEMSGLVEHRQARCS